MRIFGKHIFRSIKANPKQPFLIILIVCLCAATMIISLTLPISIYRNEHAFMLADELTADIEISLKANSDRRLIFDDDVQNAIGDRGRVIGEFSLTGFFTPIEGGEKRQVKIGAFDLKDVIDFYSIQSIQGGTLTNTEIKSSAIVSESFAKENNISIGDRVKVNVLGEEFSYTVKIIAEENGIMKRDQIIVDLGSVRMALAERSPIIASLSENPFTKIHIKLNDGVDVNAMKSELESLETFGDKRVELPGDSTKGDYISMLFTFTVLIPAMLLLVVAAIMIMSTLDLLHKKRSDDMALFKISGADTRCLNRILYMESVAYGLVGGILGSILSLPLLCAIDKLYNFRYTRLSFGVYEALIGVLMSTALTLICTWLHIRKQKKKNTHEELSSTNLDTDRHFIPKLLYSGIPVVLFSILAAILPVKYKYLGSFLLLFATVAFIYVISPYIIGALASLVSTCLAKMRRGAGDFILAAKSCSNSYPLKHAGRIATVIISMFLSLNLVLTVITSQLDAYVDCASFEYAGIGVDETTKERVKMLDGVVATAEATIDSNVIFSDGTAHTGFSAKGDVYECLKEYILPSSMPNGNSVALSRGLVRMLDLELGDTVACEIGGVPCELVFTEIVDAQANFVFYDAEYIGSGYQMLCVVTDGSEDARQDLFSLFDERGVECLTKSEFFAFFRERNDPQMVMLRAMLYAMTLLATVGVLNVLEEQRMARRREFDIIIQNGKTKSGMVALQLVEIFYLLFFALAMSLIFSQIICFVIDISGISFGMMLYD